LYGAERQNKNYTVVFESAHWSVLEHCYIKICVAEGGIFATVQSAFIICHLKYLQLILPCAVTKTNARHRIYYRMITMNKPFGGKIK
jgi:hypothetical protein